MPLNHEIHEILSCDEICAPVDLRIRDVGSPELLAEPGLIPEDGSLAIPFNSDEWIMSMSRLKHLHATHSSALRGLRSHPVALLLYELELLNGSMEALRVMYYHHCAPARTPGP